MRLAGITSELLERFEPVRRRPMFFDSKQKKLEREREAYRLASKERRFGDALKHGEAALALAAELKNTEALAEATEVVADACIALTEWPRAQEIWAQTAAALRALSGQGSPLTLRAHVRLIEILTLREQHAEAMEVVRAFGAPAYVDDLSVRAEAPLILVRLGQHAEALELAKRLFERENETRNSARAVFAARFLAEVMVRLGQLDPAVGLLLECLRFPVTDEATLTFRLRCEATLSEALMRRGDFNEVAASTRDTINGLTLGKAPPLRTRESIVALLRLQALRAEAGAALGQLEDSARYYSWAVRHVETELKNPRDVALIPLLEGYARVLRRKGDEKGAEVHERRAGAIRLQVTGRKEPSARPEEPAPAPRQAWPRRTHAGIFAIRGVNQNVLKHISEQTYAAYKGPQLQGLDVVNPDTSGQAFLLMRQFSKAWDPAVAVAIKHLHKALGAVVDTVNAGIALSAGPARGAAITVAPWFAVADFIQCAWWTWPVEERERIKREVFPLLPGWVGPVDNHFEWLGRGVRQEGTTCLVAPNARMDFVPQRGIAFGAMGPPELVDAWFLALARETRWFPAGAYEPLAPQPMAAAAVVARA